MGADMDKDLADGLKAAKSKRAYFALVLKGSNDGALLVAKAKVPPAAIATAKKQSGGSAVVKGFCLYEDGKYVFETAKQAPATAAQAVKAIAKRDAGLAVHAEFRISADPELLADEEDSADASSAAAPPPPDGAGVIKRFHAMTADIQNALGGPNNDRVKALFAAIRDALVKKDFAAATKNIDELAPLVKPAPAAAAPPPAGLAAKITTRLNALTPDIKTALAGPNQAGVKSLLAAIHGQVKNKDFLLAIQGLRDLESLLGQASSSPHAAPPPAPPPPSRLAAKLTTRLNGMTGGIKAALAGPDRAHVKSLLVAVDGQIKNKDFLVAVKGLRELEQSVRQANAAAASRQASDDLTRRLNPLMADIKAALAGPLRARVQSLLAAIGGQIKNKDFVKAGRVLDLLGQSVNTAATS